MEPLTIKLTLDPETADMLFLHKPRSLPAATYCALLVEQGLDRAATLGAERSEAPSKAVSTPSKRTSFKPKKESVGDALGPYVPLILEFWKTKKGAKSETAWNFLLENLERIRAKYGPQVVEEQLKLAINGKWQSIQLKNFEQFSGKADAKEPEFKHPAGKVFTAKDFDVPRNASLSDLF